MGLFSGGNSSSSNKTENFETNITTSTDIQRDSGFQDSGGVAAIAGDNNVTNIEILDDNAINSAFDFAAESQAFWGENFDSVLGTIEKTNENSVVSQRVIADAFNNDKAITATSGISQLLPVVSGGILIGGLVFLVKALRTKS